MSASQGTNREILYRASADRDRPISDAVVAALAAVENVDPEELDLRLYDSVDADALDRFVDTATERGERLRVAFTIDDYEVTVEDGERVVVRERCDRRRKRTSVTHSPSSDRSDRVFTPHCSR